jgi:hypothetical protein
MLETATGAATNDEIVMIVSLDRSPGGSPVGHGPAVYPRLGSGRLGPGHTVRKAARHAAARGTIRLCVTVAAAERPFGLIMSGSRPGIPVRAGPAL